jgi:hypothetical protein
MRRTCRQAAVMVPNQRLMLCHAWAEADEKAIHSGTSWYEVLGIEVHPVRGGYLRDPVILCDGAVVNVEECLGHIWPESSCYEVFLATWPRDCDQKHLAEHGERLEGEALRMERERLLATGGNPMLAVCDGLARRRSALDGREG